MSNKLIVFGLFIFISGIVGERENVTVVKEIDNQGRSGRDLIYRGLIVCAFRYDADCFMNVAQNFLDLKRTQLLAQADQEVARASGSSSVQAKPSQVAQTIEKLFSDLAGLFRDGFSSLFSSKDDDDDLSSEKSNDAEKDDDDDEDDDDKKEGNSSRDVGDLKTPEVKTKLSNQNLTAIKGIRRNNKFRAIEDISVKSARKKKKKKNGLKQKIMKLVLKISLGVIIFTILTYFLKFFYAILAFKHWLVSVKFLIIYALKTFFHFKKNYWDSNEVVVYKSPHIDFKDGSQHTTQQVYDLNSLPPKKKWDWEEKAKKLHDAKYSPADASWYMAK